MAGSLFLPTMRVQATPGMEARLCIQHAGHLEPRVRIVRLADIQTSSIPAVRGVGLEFQHLTHHERQVLEHLIAEVNAG